MEDPFAFRDSVYGLRYFFTKFNFTIDRTSKIWNYNLIRNIVYLFIFIIGVVGNARTE